MKFTHIHSYFDNVELVYDHLKLRKNRRNSPKLPARNGQNARVPGVLFCCRKNHIVFQDDPITDQLFYAFETEPKGCLSRI